MSKYDDIMYLPHPVSKKHPHMTNINRGAQFSPFAALTGYDSLIDETGRQTSSKIELDDLQIRELNDMLLYLKTAKNVKINIVYFVKDKLKFGGEYISQTLVVKKLDEDHRQLVIDDGRIISIEDILSITRC